MQELVYLNGWIGSFEDAFISVNDRSYTFGDGIYEVIRVYNGLPFAMADHMERLEHSASVIKLNLPWSSEQLAMFTEDLLAQSGIREAIIYIQEVLPVVKVDDHTIGDGKPGALTRRILDGFTSLRRQSK